MQMLYVQGHTRCTCLWVRVHVCWEVMVTGRGSSDSVLCALNGDMVTATSAEGPEYIDYRTFNLITYTYIFRMVVGMHLQ